jgi:hypothetical protein
MKKYNKDKNKIGGLIRKAILISLFNLGLVIFKCLRELYITTLQSLFQSKHFTLISLPIFSPRSSLKSMPRIHFLANTSGYIFSFLLCFFLSILPAEMKL